jgi:uncharacterized MAPEG superfamily protein
MTIAYWCVLLGALQPFMWTSYAKFTAGFGERDNHTPREFLEKLSGTHKRAHWAQLNAFEAFPPLAAAVLIASHVGKLEQGTLDALAVAWVVCRFLYGVLYITDRATLRSVAWFAAAACWVTMFVRSA